MSSKIIKVIAYSGYRSDELPRSFFINDEKIDVTKVIRSWLVEDKESGDRRRFFKVKGSDGYVHTIFYDESSKEWYLP